MPRDSHIDRAPQPQSKDRSRCQTPYFVAEAGVRVAKTPEELQRLIETETPLEHPQI